MKLIFTVQAEKSLKEVLDFLTAKEVPLTKIITIRDNILAKAEMLVVNPKLGQKEAYLDHLGMNHRRVIESHYKIIYRIKNDDIYVTDIFDSRAGPKQDERVAVGPPGGRHGAVLQFATFFGYKVFPPPG